MINDARDVIMSSKGVKHLLYQYENLRKRIGVLIAGNFKMCKKKKQHFQHFWKEGSGPEVQLVHENFSNFYVYVDVKLLISNHLLFCESFKYKSSAL